MIFFFLSCDGEDEPSPLPSNVFYVGFRSLDIPEVIRYSNEFQSFFVTDEKLLVIAVILFVITTVIYDIVYTV